MLQIQHIQHYPIGGENGLKIFYNDKIYKVTSLHEFSVEAYRVSPVLLSSICQPYGNIKPLLRPMSDLYKERNGKIDIVELAKIYCPSSKWILGLYEDVENNESWQIATDKHKSWMFYYSEHHKGFHSSNYGYYDYIVCNQLALFQYLFENHYDVFGLIGQRLAIDLKTVEI